MRQDHYVMYKRENGLWYYYAYKNGKRVRKSTGEKKRTAALEVIHDRLLDGDLLNEKENTCSLFRDFVKPFWNPDTCPILKDKLLRGGHYSVQRAQTFRLNTQKYLVPPFGSKDVSDITPSMINSWLLSLPEKFSITPQTANKQLYMFRQMMDVAVARKLVLVNPCASVKPLIPKPSQRGCFTPEQIKILFSKKWGNTYLELACQLAAVTGMRAGEVRGLQKQDIKNDHIELCHAWAEKEGLKTTKSGKPRIVPISPALRDRLLNVPNNGPFVFSLQGKKPLCQDLFIRGLKEHMKKCKIDYKTEKLGFHSFRHFFNTRLISAGVDGLKIRAVIGHESEKMTEHYAHLSADDLRQIRFVQESISI